MGGARECVTERAFVKDDDPTGGAAVLPDRPISPTPIW